MQNLKAKILWQLYYIFLIVLLSIYSEITAQSLMSFPLKSHTSSTSGMVLIVIPMILCYIMYIKTLTWRCVDG